MIAKERIEMICKEHRKKEPPLKSLNLSIVMPTYNESECIQKVVKEWYPVVEKLDGQFVMVNDGSKDHTGEILDSLVKDFPRLKVIHQKNGGHGSAVLTGYRAAIESGSDYIFQTDTDDQVEVADFYKLWELRKQSPFVTGYRQQRNDALHRLVITRINRFLNFVLFGVWVKDSNIPFRLIRRKFLSQLLEVIPRHVFAPNIFLAFLAKRQGARLFEIPISHKERTTGQVSIIRFKLLKVCFQTFGQLVKFRWSLFTNRKRLAQHKLEIGKLV
jgi:dolichol-phosphate mannosyltransferase